MNSHLMDPSADTLFRALGDPTRRAIFEHLAREGEQTVRALTDRAGVSQPAVSKHLGVLRKVGVVTTVKRGQHRMYRLEAAKLKPIHDWVKTFERYWSDQISRIKERAEQKAMDRIARENEMRKDKK